MLPWYGETMKETRCFRCRREAEQPWGENPEVSLGGGRSTGKRQGSLGVPDASYVYDEGLLQDTMMWLRNSSEQRGGRRLSKSRQGAMWQKQKRIKMQKDWQHLSIHLIAKSAERGCVSPRIAEVLINVVVVHTRACYQAQTSVSCSLWLPVSTSCFHPGLSKLYSSTTLPVMIPDSISECISTSSVLIALFWSHSGSNVHAVEILLRLFWFIQVFP